MKTGDRVLVEAEVNAVDPDAVEVNVYNRPSFGGDHVSAVPERVIPLPTEEEIQALAEEAGLKAWREWAVANSADSPYSPGLQIVISEFFVAAHLAGALWAYRRLTGGEEG